MTMTARSLLLAAACWLSPLASPAAEPPKPNPAPLKVERLRGNVYVIHEDLFEAIPAGYAPTKLSKNLVLVDRKGSLMVDTDDHAASLDKFREALTRVPGLKDGKVGLIVNTHWHLDHTGLNAAFAARGSVIAGHWNSLEILRDPPRIRDVVGFDGTGDMPPLEPAGMPTRIVSHQAVTLKYKSETVELIPYLGAHSNTDIAVYFRKANAIHLGDLFFGILFPFVDRTSGGGMKSLIRTLKSIDGRINDQTLVVPSHGSILTRAQFRDTIAMLEQALVRVQALVDKKLDEEAALATKPFADMEAVRGWFFVPADQFTRVIYRELTRAPR